MALAPQPEQRRDTIDTAIITIARFPLQISSLNMQPPSCPFDGTVLIVEDHPLYSDALAHLARIIFARGQVVEAASAETGLRIASTLSDLRLVLLDFRLSGLGGVEAVSAFHQKFPLARVVVISASEDRREATAALCAGAKAFVSKAAR